MKRIIKAKWVHKQILTCKLSSDGHPSLPLLICSQVRWAQTRTHITHTYTLSISTWQCHSSLETKPSRDLMHYPLHIARPQCNRNLSIKMDSFCSLCTYFKPEKKGKGGQGGLGEEREGKHSMRAEEKGGERFHRTSSWVHVKTITVVRQDTDPHSVYMYQRGCSWSVSKWSFTRIHSGCLVPTANCKWLPLGLSWQPLTSSAHPAPPLSP